MRFMEKKPFFRFLINSYISFNSFDIVIILPSKNPSGAGKSSLFVNASATFRYTFFDIVKVT